MITGHLFQGEVRDLSVKGYGVVDHPEGLVFFVKNTWPGDKGEFEIESVEKRYGFAKINKITEPSPHRVNPPCPHQGYKAQQCGGCPWMMADYNSQLQYKEKFLRHQLERAKVNLSQTKFSQIWASPQQLGYRNRAQLKTDGKAIGYVERESKNLAPIKDCLVLSDKNRETLRNLIEKLPNSEWNPGEKYSWNFIDIDENISAEEITLNRRRPFLQGNTEQNKKMREWIKVKLPNKTKTLELFCGSGNFTEILAELGHDIQAIEVNSEAITQLKNKNLKNVNAFVMDLYKPSILKKITGDFQTLLLDPPREGFESIAKLVKNLPELNRILYVSCDATTFARDCKNLEKLGWNLSEIQPVDQFPHTPHVEILSVLKCKQT